MRIPPAQTVVVCPPQWLASNPETATTNAYQREGNAEDRELALKQFDNFVATLEGAGIQVFVLPTPDHAPDAVFPNNWFSTHPDGTLAIYPMLAPSRRKERNLAALATLLDENGFTVAQLRDFTEFESHGRFLEGTGSVIYDHTHRSAYACISPRTDPEVLAIACAALAYQPIAFTATDAEMAVYHTNVVMAIGSDFAVVCTEAIADPTEVIADLRMTGKQVISITREQMRSFCGNIIELAGPSILMSSQAHAAFRSDQLDILSKNRQIIHADIAAIEKLGGGSARCMVAEIFLPQS